MEGIINSVLTVFNVINLPPLSMTGGYIAAFVVAGFMIFLTKEIIFWE